MKSTPKTPVKTQPIHRKHGWVERPPHAPVPTCACGNKYIKTRAGQKHCLRCIHDPNIPVTL